jgi:hypothetical protein
MSASILCTALPIAARAACRSITRACGKRLWRAKSSSISYVTGSTSAFASRANTGGEVTLPCCNVFRLRDGLVAEYRMCSTPPRVYA